MHKANTLVLSLHGLEGIKRKMKYHYLSTLQTSITFWTPVAVLLYGNPFYFIILYSVLLFFTKVLLLKHLKFSKNGLIQIFFRDKRLRENLKTYSIKNVKQKDEKRIKSFIPVKFRVIFAQTVTLIWNTYLSWKANLSTRKQK